MKDGRIDQNCKLDEILELKARMTNPMECEGNMSIEKKSG